jgi:hypothetical protein
MATKSKRKRDFKAEYRARIARGLASGKSRSEARGHAKARDLGIAPGPFDKKDKLEQGLRLMKKGLSQKEAAKFVGVSTERLRRYQQQNAPNSRREGGRWIIVDERPATLVLASRGQLVTVTVSRDAASDIGRYWDAVNKFLESNDPSHLALFRGMGVSDLKGKLWPYETRPNVLRKLDSVGELSFVDIYRQTAQQ